MTTLLQSVLQSHTAVSNFAPWIAVLMAGYLAYEVFFKKNRQVIELLTTAKVLPLAAVLIVLALAPVPVSAIFGINAFFEGLGLGLLQIITAVLTSSMIVSGATLLLKLMYPRFFE